MDEIFGPEFVNSTHSIVEWYFEYPKAMSLGFSILVGTCMDQIKVGF